MKSVILALLLFAWQVLASVDASAFSNEPDGFKDMKWGVSADSLFTKDDFIGFSADDNSARYVRISDEAVIEIDGVRLYGIVCSFYKGKLWKVELEARLLQAGKLLEVFAKKYGEPSSVGSASEFSKEYFWSGTATDILLKTSLNYFDRKTVDIATAAIYSRKAKAAIDGEIAPAVQEKQLPVDKIDGFRGRPWGSGFDASVTYLPLEKEPFFEYLIKNDVNVFEGVNVREIRYRFYNNRELQKVELHVSGKRNYLKLKEACFRLFGSVSRHEDSAIRWVGKKTTVSLSFFIDDNGMWQGRLVYFGFGSH